MKNILRYITLFCLISACTSKVKEKTIEYNNTVFNNNSYKVITNPKTNEVGEIITVIYKDNDSTFTVGETQWAQYYFSIIDEYLLIDEGTGTVRGLIVYNLDSQEIIFEHAYMGELVKLNNEIHFKYEVIIAKKSNKPECPQEIIDIGYGLCYLEQLIYDLDGNKFIRTGHYECAYCE